jgi:hypothetical protein
VLYTIKSGITLAPSPPPLVRSLFTLVPHSAQSGSPLLPAWASFTSQPRSTSGPPSTDVWKTCFDSI